ncbi:MAG TPA: biosynthetic-type acetolactate synthase large subunit [Clostridiaceae bacterium]
MLLKGAQVFIECLREQNVDVIFGYPGGAVLPIYDALYGVEDITHILTAHEQGATHAADGYSRVSDKVGVVLVTSGPGATNTVTGIATAYADSVPMVVFTGQVPTELIGKDSFQEVDIIKITDAITKKNYLVLDVKELAGTIRKAFKLAKFGRPGPVLIDIPKDIQNALVEYEYMDILEEETVNDELSIAEAYSSDIDTVIKAINSSKKPVIYAGGGIIISGAEQELKAFSEKIKAPVTCSLMGIGAFPGDDPYYMGMVGMHGSKCSNLAVSRCDLLIAIGARFSDRVVSEVKSFAGNAHILHIDIDFKELGKNVQLEYSLCGDCKNVLKYLIENVEEKKEGSWNKEITENKIQHPLRTSSLGELGPAVLLGKLNEIFKDECIITTEVGQNQIWTAQYYKFTKIRTFISSGGLGTMGYGLGAAIGASFANPKLRVINIAGDGSFKMNSTELATIAKYKLPIIQLVLNNHVLGMVRQWQNLFYQGRYSQTTLGPDVDFMKLAQAYGIKALKITKNEEIEDVLMEAKAYNGPVVIECEIHPDEKIYPIVPPGAPITEAIE